MIVLDASATVELLLRLPLADLVEACVEPPGQTLHAPHLLDIEVAQVVRRFERSGRITAERGAQALTDLSDLDVNRYPHTHLLPLVWEYRTNLTAYDAAYVALAFALRAPLLTTDAKLAAAPLPELEITLVG